MTERGNDMAGTSGIGAMWRHKRVLAASLIGTAVEFYDFYIYATAASLIFPALFFPCLLYTSPSPRDRQKSRMPSSA